MSTENKMREILAEAQAKALPADASRADIIAYCNACINSGTGALAHHYRNNPAAADFAVYAVLRMWLTTVEARVNAHEAAEAAGS